MESSSNPGFIIPQKQLADVIGLEMPSIQVGLIQMGLIQIGLIPMGLAQTRSIETGSNQLARRHRIARQLIENFIQ
jgi:hypothetical protein